MPLHAYRASDKLLRQTSTADPLAQDVSVFSVGNGFIGVRGVSAIEGVTEWPTYAPT